MTNNSLFEEKNLFLVTVVILDRTQAKD